MLVSAPGAEDLRRSADDLAARLPSALAPLARLAFDYRWSWIAGGEALFAAIDPHRWQACGQNPVRLLQECATGALERAAADRELIRRAYALEECIAGDTTRTLSAGSVDPARPVVFLCAEYGVHPSLPIYAGGLGVLAGDLLKAASDAGLPLVAVGLLYHQGYFRQRIDASGWQHEYWVATDPPRLPGALVTRDGLEPLCVHVPIRGRNVAAQIWRVDVGRVPLYLLDTDRSDNEPVDRWITSRLYVGDRDTRLAQYALLGIGGARALAAMGIEPGVLHLNEGHAALAPLELAAGDVGRGASFDDALEAARERTVFTTHTPVPAGNETYSADEVRRVLGGFESRLGTDWNTFLGLTRVDPADDAEPSGMTSLGLRVSRSANGVSERHGGVARGLWRSLFGMAKDDEVPIGFVTNGVHLETWMAEPVRELLDEHLGWGWHSRTLEPDTWARLEEIPDAELWRVRCQLRARLVETVREHATLDRLARGEEPGYVELASRAFDPDRLTFGFARRLATYKRLHLIGRDMQRSLRLIRGPIQILLAGKAHPSDDGAKQVVQRLFEARRAPHVGERIAYLHDYDMQIAKALVSGCDVWVNLPRPPLEASGTSGMKAALNGGLNLSVLDGWWAEADGEAGWSLSGEVDEDIEAQDDRDAQAYLDLIEKEVVPLFYDRDADGVPRGWMKKVKAAIRMAGQRFTARRMLHDYAQTTYRRVP
ncbi:MAG: alpha-glucan family phosphorylase [Myxococcota bacterium]|nr:alpha-glucan family phosphorylase [Myxococcota bacterium]